MESKNRFSKYMFGALLILSAAVSISIANKTLQYEIVVKGILGLAVIYLLFFYIRFSGIDASMDTMLSDSKKHKYFLYALIGPGLAYWAIGGGLDMLSLLAKYLLAFLK